MKADKRLGTSTISLKFIKEIGLVQPFKLEESDQTFKIGRAFAWGNIRLFDEIKNGGDSRFDELRNDPKLSRLLVEDPPASEVSVEEALTAANKIIKVSRTLTSTLKPIGEAFDIEEKTDCAIISRQTGFNWLSEESRTPSIRKLDRRKKRRRR